MHPTKELLIRLRNHLKNDGYLSTGLCNIVRCHPGLTSDETNTLLDYVDNHRPKFGKHFDPGQKYSEWYWPWGAREARINWLNDQIKNFHKNR